MSKIIVTGGAGFIGSNLVDKLIELGHSVTIIDDLSTGKKENINPKAEFICQNISEIYFGGKIDYVFHLAAIARVPYSIEHPTKTHRVNITGTYNILKASSDIGVKKVIFASSSSVYGDQELPLKETMIPKPKSPYAFQKFVGEGYMKMFNEVYGLPTVSLRFFNVYGHRMDMQSDYSLLFGKWLKLKKEGKPLTIFGNGNQTRDFTYVTDVVDALILSMESPVQNEVINVCNGKQTSILKIAEVFGGKKEFLPERQGDILHTMGDNTKIKALLKWNPKIPIEEGLKIILGDN
jgi:UDP-glucose 4-epimerase